MSVRDRLPLALSSAALLLAVLGLTPIGEAASNLAERVFFARDTQAVNGLKASRVARPNTLLPLGSDRRFPASVVPRVASARGPAGAAGVAGGEGPAGPDGGHAIVVERRRLFVLPAGETTVLELEAPAGAWVVNASVELFSNDTGPATVVSCRLVRDTAALGAGHATVGAVAGGSRTAALPVLGSVTLSEPGTLRLRCEQDGDGEERTVDVQRATLSALRVESITEVEGGGG